jgi:GTPase SAR1 family protein
MAIRNLLDRFYRPKTDGFKVFLFGLDCSGKTTLLYKLALGEVITTIPTIGFNVETVKAQTTSGRDLTMTAWDVGPGCGGAQHMIPMVAHLTASTDAIVWVVDSIPSAAYTLDESAALLDRLLQVIALRHTETVRKDFPILM